MSIDVNNIELGEGNLTLEVEGDAAAVDVGACEGMQITTNPKVLDITCGQTMHPIESFVIADEFKFKIDLKEDTLRHFVIAIGGDPAEITTDLSVESYLLPGGSIRRMPFVEVVYAVPRVADATKFTTYTFYKCKSDGKIAYAFNKDKERIITLEMQAFADSENSNSPGKIERDVIE
jgi:hypothetical protein